MPDISKIKLKGITYDIKDTEARNGISNIDTITQARVDEITDYALASFPSPVYAYETVADMQADKDLQEGMIVHTNGFHTAGDGGAAYYKVSSTGTANSMDVLALQGGLKATLVITESYITPEQFGAYGDGVHDDTSLLAACLGSGSKKIALLGDSYLVSNTLTVADGTELMCRGKIVKNGTFDVLLSVGNDTDIIVNIDVNQASATVRSSELSADVHISNKSNVRIHDSSIVNTDSRYAIMIEKSSDVSVEKCQIDTYVYTGIGLRDGNKNVKIQSNSITNGHGSEINRYPIVLNSSPNLTVSNGIICDSNYIEDEIPMWEGIDAHGLLNAVISNNVIINTLTGISIVGGSSVENVAITGNVYKGGAILDAGAGQSYGIVFCVDSGAHGVIINGNSLYGCGINSGVSVNGGIRMYGTTGAIIANNNISVTSGVGIRIQSASGNTTNDFIVDGNTVSDAETGILVENGAGINVTGEIRNNVIKNCTTGISGMARDGTGFDSCVYAKDNIYAGCITNYANNTKGLLVSPSGTTSSGYGKEGMIIDFFNPDRGFARATCTQSASGATPAVWVAAYDMLPISGTYTLNSSGSVEIANARILATAHCVANVVYTDAASLGRSVVTKCAAGKVIAYVYNADGTPATGSVDLALVVYNRS